MLQLGMTSCLNRFRHLQTNPSCRKNWFAFILYSSKRSDASINAALDEKSGSDLGS